MFWGVKVKWLNKNDKRVTDPSGVRSPHFYKHKK